jgi:hypothetical protein
MPLYFSSKGSGDSKRVSPGTHFAVCDMVVFLGLQQTSGNFPKVVQQLYVRFEIPTERWDFEKDGKKRSGPAVIGQTFTASMHKKANLRKQLAAWRGKAFTDEEADAFDVSKILGKSCMLSVTENESGGVVYSNISSFSALPKGSKLVQPELPLRYYAPDDTACFETLPEWIKEKIKGQLSSKPPTPPSANQAGDEWDQQAPIEAYENVHGLMVSDNDLPDMGDDSDPIPF